MKRAERGSTKVRQPAPTKRRGAEGSVRAEPDAARPSLAVADDKRARALEMRVQALEIENAKLAAIAQTAVERAVKMVETVALKQERNKQELADLRREIAEKNQVLERNLLELGAVRKHLGNILESLPVGVVATDIGGSITAVNRVAKTIIGRDGRELLGQRINDVMGIALTPENGAAPEASDTISYTRPDGETLRLSVSCVHMPGEGGQQPGYVVNLQDVTQLKKLEEQSARRNRFTAMGEMAANIAHEIRNPLGSIELFASLVRKGLDGDDEKMAHLNHISSAVTSMNHIISNVLEYTKPRAVSLKELDLHGLLRELEGFFSFQCQQNGVTLALNLEAPDPWIRADREMLKQVFHNLLLNAVQAMPEGGRLTLATRARAVSAADLPPQLNRAPAAEGGIFNMLEVTVRDTGLGMPPEIQNKIFDPFFTTKSRGTGLGLAITHAIVEAHQATIAVESRVGLGTAMVLMFPLLRG
jgi:PAS domain S-box-containing protein